MIRLFYARLRDAFDRWKRKKVEVMIMEQIDTIEDFQSKNEQIEEMT